MIKVVCAIIVKDKKLLICLRNSSQTNAGLWEFPGGKIRLNETQAEAIKREIEEELTICIEPTKQIRSFICSNENQTIELIPFICHGYNGQIHLNEHSHYTLCEIDKLNDFTFTPADKLLCNYLEKNPQLLLG